MKEEKDDVVVDEEEETSAEETTTEKEEGALSSEEALAGDEESKKTGENTHGVLSPDPIVGETVPSDYVAPGQKVDPRSGAVIDGGDASLATPRPNAPKPEDRNLDEAKESGEGWAGHHTV